MPKYASSEQTYDALIEAAGELAADKGFANVSTRAIAAKAGANISSIHYHFGGKEGLFEAVVRRISDHINNNSYEQVIKKFEGELDTPLGQAKAVAAIMQRHIDGFFDKDKPWWYAKVIYQSLQYDNHIYEVVNREFVEPMSNAIYGLLEKIIPGMSVEDKVLYNIMTVSFCAMHSNYRIPILHSLGCTEYSDGYVEKLKNIATRVVQQALGLPVYLGE